MHDCGRADSNGEVVFDRRDLGGTARNAGRGTPDANVQQILAEKRSIGLDGAAARRIKGILPP